jgi:hypothetical protein
MALPWATDAVEPDLAWVLRTLSWLRREKIWPNGLRYLWTDAFGLVLLVSLHEIMGDERFLDQAQDLVAKVYWVLGRPRGLRIGEAPDRDGQYYHYLAMWVFALTRLARHRPRYRQIALNLVREIHPAFVQPGRGVIWKMREDLSGPYPGYGWGALDHLHGYVVYRLLDQEELAAEIAQLRELVESTYRSLTLDQDLGLGMVLWLSHFFPREDWARHQRKASLEALETMWIEPPGYFCRHPRQPGTRLAFANYGVSIGLQAVGASPRRVERLHQYFDAYRSGDHYDRDAITHVMGCVAHLPGLMLAVQDEESGG